MQNHQNQVENIIPILVSDVGTNMQCEWNGTYHPSSERRHRKNINHASFISISLISYSYSVFPETGQVRDFKALQESQYI